MATPIRGGSGFVRVSGNRAASTGGAPSGIVFKFVPLSFGLSRQTYGRPIPTLRVVRTGKTIGNENPHVIMPTRWTMVVRDPFAGGKKRSSISLRKNRFRATRHCVSSALKTRRGGEKKKKKNTREGKNVERERTKE